MTEERLIAALINSTLQTIALCALIAVVLRAFSRTSASARCAVWTGALLVAIALPAVDYARIQSVAAPEVAKVVHTPAPILQRAVAAPPALHIPDQTAPISSAAVRFSLASVVSRIAHYALFAWFAGAAFFALRLVYQIACLWQAKAAVLPAEAPEFLRASRLRRRVALGLSDRVAVPCLLGLFRPVIALPRLLAANLSDDDLQRIVLHEAAHLERFDDWFNLLEQVALVVFFFNPALHYIARQIGTEREIACDDHVIAKSQNRITYAECLTELARRCAGRRALTVPGFFTNRRQILVRVEQLLDRAHNGSPQIGRKAFAGIGVMALTGLMLSQVGIPVVAANICPRAFTSVAAIAARVAAVPPPALRARLELPVALRDPVAPRAPQRAPRALPALHAVPVALPMRPASRPRPLTAPRAALAPAPALPVTAPPAPAAAEDSTVESAAPIARAVNAIAVATSERGQDASYSDGPSLSGYSGMSVDEIVALHDHGVDGRYIAAMKAAGYSNLKADELMKLRDHDVSGAFATSMAALARHRLDVDELVLLRDHGVSALYASSIAQYGLRGIPVDQLVDLRDHGVSAEYLAALAQVGYGNLSAADTIRLRDHGVTASYIQHIRHDLNPSTLTIDELIRLRDSGI